MRPFALANPRFFSPLRLLAVLLPMLAAAPAAHAQAETREGIALQNQIYQMRQELQTLRADIARSGGGATGGGGNDVAAQLLSRVQTMEEQLRQLRGRIDETQNLVNRHHADVLKRIDDLAFQMNLPGRANTTPPPAIAAPKPEPIRPPEPAPAEAARPEPLPKVALPPPPDIIPLPPPAPPRSFTFNQIPEPMRETPRAAPTPAPVPAPVPPPMQTTIRLDPSPRIETPRVETPRVEPQRPEPPNVEPPRAEPARPEPPRLEPPRPEPPRPEPQRVDPVRPVPPAATPRPVPAPKPPATAQTPETTPLAPVPPGGKRTPEMALQEGHAALARRDYAAAERAAREVMSSRASPRAYDGQFLLAQSLAGQKQYAQAAIAFDDAYNRSHKGRHAQDALIGLASSLTAINERRAACDTLGRLRTEFPQVRADLQETITRTNDRAACGR